MIHQFATSRLKASSRSVSADAIMAGTGWPNNLMPRSTAVGDVKPASPAAASGNTEEKLFQALADMKVLYSQMAMHMDRSWRSRIFAQLDRIHDAEEWDAEDDPAKQASFLTFLRMMFLIKPGRQPGLAIATGGNLVAHWIVGNDRLEVECRPDDQLRVVLVRWLDGQREAAALDTHVERIGSILQAYEPSCWFEVAR